MQHHPTLENRAQEEMCEASRDYISMRTIGVTPLQEMINMQHVADIEF